MNRIDRYIFKTIVGSSLVTLLVLVMLDFFISLLAELQSVGENDYGLAQIFQFLALGLPSRIYQAFPTSLLLGGLLGMGALASSSELVVMRAAGCSLLRLVGAALQAGLVLGLMALALGEFVAPRTEQLAQDMRARAQNKSLAINDGKGFWARDGNKIINVRAVLPDVMLSEIFVYELDEKSDLRSLGRAERGRFVDGEWVLEGLTRSVMSPERVVTESVPRIPMMGSVIGPDMLEILSSDPKDLSMRDLLHYIRYLVSNGLDARAHELAFWLKVLGPLSNLAMLLVAMPFVFGSHRSVTTGQRLMVGIGLGLLFFLLNRLLSNLVLLYGYHPFIGASLPTVLFMVGGALALQRMR